MRKINEINEFWTDLADARDAVVAATDRLADAAAWWCCADCDGARPADLDEQIARAERAAADARDAARLADSQARHLPPTRPAYWLTAWRLERFGHRLGG